MKQGWEVKKIGELCNLSTGGTPSRSKPEYFSNGGIKWLVSGDIHKREIFDCEGRITEEAMKNSNTKFLPLGSVLIALNGQGKTRGTVALLRTKATCNQSLVSIYPKDTKIILPEYIFCYLHSKYDEIRKITGDNGNERRGLNMPLIRNIEIPVPSIKEQQCLVTVLDKVFSDIAKVKENAEQNLKNAKELFESYLQNVFSNKGDDWESKELMQVCEQITDGSHFSPKSFEEGKYPYITVRDINNDIIDFNNCKFVSEKDYKLLSKNGCKPNYMDLLFSKDGTVGKVSLVDFEKDFVVLSSLAIIRPKNKIIISSLLKYILKDPSFIKTAIGMKTGVAIRRIILKNLKLIEISFPKSIKEQKKIIKKLDSLLVETKKLEVIYQNKINDLEELKKSILHKAFNGELKSVKV